MANGRKQVDLGFAEFAAHVVAELHEGLLVAQNEQESRRAKLAELSSLPLEEFARRFITNEQVEAELVRLFPVRRAKAHRIRVGASYVAKAAKHAGSPPALSIDGAAGERTGLPDKSSGIGELDLTLKTI